MYLHVYIYKYIHIYIYIFIYIYMCVWHDSFICMPSLLNTCDMTNLRIHMCGTTHSVAVCCSVLQCVAGCCSIHMCGTTHSCIRYGSFICMPGLIHTCDMTYLLSHMCDTMGWLQSLGSIKL